MDDKRIEMLVEAIVFVMGEPIDRRDIINKLEITEEQLSNAVCNLQQKYKAEESGIQLLEFGSKLQLATNSDLVDDIMKVICPVRERALTKSTIETLSIIAYKQPITRLEIEEIRGVASDYAIGILIDHKLIEVVGKKDAVGKPLLFGTTEEFLRRFNLDSIESLPDKESLTERIATLKKSSEEEGSSLYRTFDVSSEEIIPEKVRERLKENLLNQDKNAEGVDPHGYESDQNDYKFV